LLKDDKSFPFVKLSVQEPWPRLSVTRRVLDDGARYLGPFTDVKALRRTLRDLRRIFPIRTCRNFEDYRRQDRPCLYYHIRRCVGPCYSRARVDPAEYRGLVDGLLLLLAGRNDELLGRLEAEMGDAAGERRDETGLLETWVTQYALARLELPARVLVAALPEDHRVLADALSRRAGRTVELAAPARGRPRRLVELAQKNAAAALEQRLARAAGR